MQAQQPPAISFVPELDKTLRDLATALNPVPQLKWGVHGSCAARVRGATIIQPDDIDVLVNRLMDAKAALLESHRFEFVSGRPGGVQKFKHIETSTMVDLADAQDFLPNFETSPVETIPFFTLAEVLVSLILRPERRDKEIKAFAYLVIKCADLLYPDEKKRICERARAKTWPDVVENAGKAAAHYGIKFV